MGLQTLSAIKRDKVPAGMTQWPNGDPSRHGLGPHIAWHESLVINQIQAQLDSIRALGPPPSPAPSPEFGGFDESAAAPSADEPEGPSIPRCAGFDDPDDAGVTSEISDSD
jgi:hypothetical protein